MLKLCPPLQMQTDSQKSHLDNRLTLRLLFQALSKGQNLKD
jgi:hypothetical protein